MTTNIVNKVAPITPVKPLNFALLGVQRNLSTPLRTPTYEAYRLKMTHETNVFLEASHSNSSIGANILLEEKEPVLKSNLKRDITDNLESTAELKRVEISTIESEILDSTKLHLENEKFMNPDKNAFFSKSDHEGSVKSIVKEAPIQFSQPQTAIVIAEVPQKNIVKFSFLNVFFLSAAYTDFGSSLSKNDREFSLKLNSEGKLGNGINRLSHFIVYWDFLISCMLNLI